MIICIIASEFSETKMIYMMIVMMLVDAKGAEIYVLILIRMNIWVIE